MALDAAHIPWRIAISSCHQVQNGNAGNKISFS